MNKGINMSFAIKGSRIFFGRSIYFIGRSEKSFFSSAELRLIQFHEIEHTLQRSINLDFRGDDLHAQLEASKRMIKEGYSFKQLIDYEINYRIWYKYGISFKEYCKKIKELKK